MKITLSKLALAELDAILDYVADHSPSGAKLVETRFRQLFEHIAQHPGAAQIVQQRPRIRRIPAGRFPYIVYYIVDGNEVTIVRILHAARRQPWSG